MTTKTVALLCLLVLPFGAIVAVAPWGVRVQTKPAESFAPPQKPSPKKEITKAELLKQIAGDAPPKL